MKATKYFIIAVSMTMVLSCGEKTVEKADNEQIVYVKAESITETTTTLPVNCSGILSSKRISKLSFKTGGIINKLLVEEGSSVKKGQLLASLDMTEIQAQVQQARVSFEKAERDLKRVKNLYADTVLTLEQLQDATSAYDAALETKNIAEFNLKYSRITAPANGKIITKLAEENELTAPGMPVLVFSEQGNDEWVVKTGVSDKDIVAIKKGDPAVISFDAFDKKQFQAKVTQLAEAADQNSGTFEIELTVNSNDVAFVNGLVASIQITPSVKQTVSILPSEAITEADGNKAFVYVVNNENSTASKVPVTISFMQNNAIAVLEPIYKLGKIVTKGASYLEDGSRINIIQ